MQARPAKMRKPRLDACCDMPGKTASRNVRLPALVQFPWRFRARAHGGKHLEPPNEHTLRDYDPKF
jgi:hypothetical protein